MLLDLSGLPLGGLIAAFAVTALVIVMVGTRLTRLADEIADQTGMGEALTGALLLGATTSLPGSVLSVAAAGFGHTELAISNAIGGIVAQTAFLGIADLTYRKANLEHAAASLTNLTQGALLVTLLAVPLIAMTLPPVAPLGVSPASPLLILAYGLGLRLAAQARAAPMWRPTRTHETRSEEDEERAPARHPVGLALSFTALAVIAGLAGFGLAEVAVALSQKTGVSQTAIGGVFTAITTSLPELVTSIAAVRRGALTLAVGGIIGGNAYDVLFLAFADLAYRPGSIYHALTDKHVFAIALSILMTGTLLLGLLRRETHGIGNIGFESVLVLLLYAGSVVVLFL